MDSTVRKIDRHSKSEAVSAKRASMSRRLYAAFQRGAQPEFGAGQLKPCLPVAAIQRCIDAPRDLHVLLRHRLLREARGYEGFGSAQEAGDGLRLVVWGLLQHVEHQHVRRDTARK